MDTEQADDTDSLDEGVPTGCDGRDFRLTGGGKGGRVLPDDLDEVVEDDARFKVCASKSPINVRLWR